MYCPRCSQQQVSEETKFCSSCGFPLGLVSELLAHGGFLPQLAEIYKSKKIFTRRNGLIFSLFWFLMFVLILTPLLGIINAPEELISMVAIIGTMGSLVMVIASFLLFKQPLPKMELYNQQIQNQQGNNLFQVAPTNQSALPPQSEQNYVPPANAWKAPDTGSFAPRSVIEGTTKLLRNEEDK